MEITESQKRAVIQRLKFIQKILPEVIKTAAEGKITNIPYEEMFVIEPAIKGLTSVNIKESTTTFVYCLELD